MADRFAASKETRFPGPGWLTGFALFLVALSGCNRVDWTRKSGVIQLPDGVVRLSSELPTFTGVSNLTIRGSGNTILEIPEGFAGRGALILKQARDVRIENLTILRNATQPPKPAEMAPPENAFRRWHKDNGILADEVDGLVEVHG